MQNRDFLLSLLDGHRKNLLQHSVSPEAPTLFAGADPWLLSSLLQKSIRRSDLAIARQAGFQLFGIDPVRLWRRLMVIALEDIGIGDPVAATFLVTLAALPEARVMLGGETRALQTALQIACDAIKDRTGDAFGAIAREMANEPAHSLSEVSDTTKLAVLGQSHLPWRRRLRAVCLLGMGEFPAHERKRRFEPLSELYRAIGVPDGLVAACELYRGKSTDLLPFFVPLAFNLWQAGGGVRTTLMRGLSSGLIGQMPGYSFDPLHTRLGRKAVELWLRSYIQRPPFELRQVTIALWNIESGACLRTLHWALGQEIEDEAWSADLLRCGLASDRHKDIRIWLETEQEVLAHARQIVWQSFSKTQHAIVANHCERQLELEPC